MENSKSNEDEDVEKICIAFGVSKMKLKSIFTKLSSVKPTDNVRILKNF